MKVNTYKTIITLLDVLCGCETCSLSLRGEHRLSVFENKVLWKIFGAKRDKITEEWRKLHNTETYATVGHNFNAFQCDYLARLDTTTIAPLHCETLSQA